MMEQNEIIEGTVTGIQPYGVFISYQSYQGLVHISEISDRYVADINQVFQVGDKVRVLVLEVDEKEKKMQLSYKRALKIHPRVAKQVDIKVGFRSIENALEDWIKEKKEGS